MFPNATCTHFCSIKLRLPAMFKHKTFFVCGDFVACKFSCSYLQTKKAAFRNWSTQTFMSTWNFCICLIKLFSWWKAIWKMSSTLHSVFHERHVKNIILLKLFLHSHAWYTRKWDSLMKIFRFWNSCGFIWRCLNPKSSKW